MNTDELIQRLGERLAPAPRVWPFWVVLLIWLTLSVVYVGVAVVLVQPLRPGVAAQLIVPGRFSLEMLVGTTALVCWTIAALAESVPALYPRWPIRLAWLLLAAWVLHFVIGFISPSLTPSMLGKRELCSLEAYFYSLPPALLMLWLQRKRYPLDPVRAAVYAAIAAAMIPALAMQVACMYEPAHILKHHVFPIAVFTLAVGLVAFAMASFSKDDAIES